jgi:hypothetical protein
MKHKEDGQQRLNNNNFLCDIKYILIISTILTSTSLIGHLLIRYSNRVQLQDFYRIQLRPIYLQFITIYLIIFVLVTISYTLYRLYNGRIAIELSIACLTLIVLVITVYYLGSSFNLSLALTHFTNKYLIKYTLSYWLFVSVFLIIFTSIIFWICDKYKCRKSIRIASYCIVFIVVFFVIILDQITRLAT